MNNVLRFAAVCRFQTASTRVLLLRRIDQTLLLHLARGDSVEQRRADRRNTDRQRR
jgi:hypothetical protein